MDLKTYLESEVGEERAQGSPCLGGAERPTADSYPGDPAVHVSEDEVAASSVRVPTGSGEQLLYLARPRGGGPFPAVVVVHENKGLVPYITDVARRLAAAGYVALAPDLLSPLGGTGSFATPGDVTAALATLDAEDVVADVRAAIAWVAEQDGVLGDRVGILGFCYGGGVAWRVLTQEPRLRVGVPFYGPPPDTDAVPGISAPVLAVYGASDQRITSMLPAIREAMAQHDKTFEALVLEGAGHAFHNDTNSDRYQPEAARRAWDVTLRWFERELRDS